MTKQNWLMVLAMAGGCGVEGADAELEIAERAYTPMAFARITGVGGVTTQDSPGGTVVSSPAVGTYAVTFNGFAAASGDGTGGNIQVTAEGGNNVRCRVLNWSGVNSVTANVRCNTPSGALADTPFAILYHRYAWPIANTFPVSAAYSYVMADGTVPPFWDYNSRAAHNTADHLDVGRYRYNITGATGINASMMVTTHGNDAVCTIGSWGAGYAFVNCVNGLGQYVDSNFSFSYSTTGPAREQQGGHAWFSASLGAVSPTYSGALGKIAGCSAASVSSTLAGSLASVSVSGDLGSWTADPFRRANFVNGYGSAKYCKVESQTASGAAPASTGTANVRCYAPDGSVIATPTFTFTHVTSDMSGPC